MFGAIDAGLIMDLAKKKEEEEKQLKETEEGRAILDLRERRAKSFDDIPEGAIAYRLTKLGRLPDPSYKGAPALYPGQSGTGYVRVFVQELLDFINENGDDFKDEDYKGLMWECTKTLKPRIGSPVFVRGYAEHFRDTWLRTTPIQSYYVHDDPNGYQDAPDKLVLPNGFPMEELMKMKPEGLEFKSGDIVMCTMNSMYLARQIEGSEYKHEEKES